MYSSVGDQTDLALMSFCLDQVKPHSFFVFYFIYDIICKKHLTVNLIDSVLVKSR